METDTQRLRGTGRVYLGTKDLGAARYDITLVERIATPSQLRGQARAKTNRGDVYGSVDIDLPPGRDRYVLETKDGQQFEFIVTARGKVQFSG